MTRDVVTITADTPVQEIARLLLEHSISAVPVVDVSGAPIGMVSEGDLIGRPEAKREARRDWWLDLLAEGEALAPEFLANLNDRKTAREVMSAPLVTIDENTEMADIVALLQSYRIKRVPVLRDGRITGIVSRADILRVITMQDRATGLENRPHAHNPIYETLARLDDRFFGVPHVVRPPEDHEPQPAAGPPAVSATDFRALVAYSEQEKDQQRDEARREAVRKHREKIKESIDHHVTDQTWQQLLHRAREAAERGENSFLLIRFPSEVCTDGGRAVNVPDPRWPATLRGEPAEIYLHWEHELKPIGFHLNARVLDFPDGLPGDIGLFLSWEQ